MNIGSAIKMYSCILILLIICETKGHLCEVENEVADCVKRNLTEVPTDLPSSITSLDLSYNDIAELGNQTFRNYEKLTDLILHKIFQNGILIIANSVFQGLPNLIRLTLSGNQLDPSLEDFSDMFIPLTSLLCLDMGKNTLLDQNKTKYYRFLNELTNLENLTIDLLNKPNFNIGKLKLEKLRKVVFETCYINEMKNNSFPKIFDNVTELHFRKCDNVQRVESDFLRAFPNVTVLTIYSSAMHLSNALKLLYPYENKSFETIDFTEVNTGFRPKPGWSTAVILTRYMMQHLQKICVRNLILGEDEIVGYEEGSLLFHEHPECFKSITFSGNRFPLTERYTDLFRFIYNLTNLELFDMSYTPLSYNQVKYIHDDKQLAGNLQIPFGRMSGNIINPALSNGHNKTLNRLSHYVRFSKQEKQHKYDFKHNIRTFPRNGRTRNVSLILPKLKILRMTHFLSRNIFKDVILIVIAPHLQYLDLSYSPLETFPRIHFKNKSKLEYINFSGIDSTLFSMQRTIPFLQKVRNVTLNFAKLGQSFLKNPEILQFVPSVEILEISSNNIWRMNIETFSQNKNIRTLVMAYNLFLEIPKAVTTLSNLTHLDIRYNFIQSLNDSITDWLDSQHRKMGNFTLKFWGNKFHCTCDTVSFIRWILKTNITLDENRNYQCLLQNRTMSNMLKVSNDFHYLFADCDSGQWLKVGIALLIALIVLIVPIAVIINFRWRIAYRIYRKFRNVVEKEMNAIFRYDVYISYGEDCLEWVKDILLPKLENSWDMITCLEDRDILAGRVYSDAISASIAESQNVIFVISDTFTERIWGAFEIERAKYEKYTRNLQRIIIIARNVSIEKFPYELTEIWNDITFIEWSENDEENGWDKLRIVLFPKTI